MIGRKRFLLGFLVLLIIAAIYSRNLIFVSPISVEYIKEKERCEGITEVSTLIKAHRFDHYLISFFSDLCKTCPSGIFMSRLEDLKRSEAGLYILAIFTNEFSETDLRNLIANLGISFEIKRAADVSGELAKRWSPWLSEAVRKHFSHGAFLLNEGGIVEAVLRPQQTGEFLSKAGNISGKSLNNEN